MNKPNYLPCQKIKPTNKKKEGSLSEEEDQIPELTAQGTEERKGESDWVQRHWGGRQVQPCFTRHPQVGTLSTRVQTLGQSLVNRLKRHERAQMNSRVIYTWWELLHLLAKPRRPGVS